MYDAINSRFIIEWNNINQYSVANSPRTFEIILYENGYIDFIWNSFFGGNINSATVGIENGAGTSGVQCSYNGSGPVNPAAQTGVRILIFGPPMPPANINLTTTPVNPPIVIPANGDTFNYNISVTNLDTVNAMVFSIWNMVTMPGGTNYGPAWGLFGTYLTAGGIIERLNSQTVPERASAGTYTYRTYVGIYPGTIWDSSSFDFTKSALTDGGKIVTEWKCWEGTDLTSAVISSIPHEYSLIGAYPNPFNPATEISFALPEEALVRLIVYDITGAEVATVVNGWMEAGTHTAVFDGSSLASGIYFCKFTAGNFSTTEKMVLVK
jgi:hypothetical protein